MSSISDKSIWTAEEQAIIEQHKKYTYHKMHTKRLNYRQLSTAIKLRIAIITNEIQYYEILKTYYKTKVTIIKSTTRQKNIEFAEAEIIRLKLILKSLNDLLEEMRDNLRNKILPSNIDTRIKDVLVEIILDGSTLGEIFRREKWSYYFCKKVKAVLYKYTGGLIKWIMLFFQKVKLLIGLKVKGSLTRQRIVAMDMKRRAVIAPIILSLPKRS